MLSAFAFNLCLFLLPLAAAAALLVIARDRLYAYEYSEAGAHVIAARVARLNGELIQLDFDRQNQWDDFVAMELRANDLHAARGFLLSGAGMLPTRSANVLNHANPNDRELEVAALQLLNPGTRTRYQEAVERGAGGAPETVGSAEDFQLMARALLAEPETDTLQFILTGYSLGLAGDLSPRMSKGAAALLQASRREDYPQGFGAEVSGLLGDSVRMSAFREAARANGGDTESPAHLAAAFRAAVVPAKAADVRALLDDIGAVSEATSHSAAATLLTHAQAIRDMPRLRLLAQAAGDRAAAAAKRLPRDGRLLAAARGQLTMTRDLLAALTVAVLALAGVVLLVAWRLWQSAAGALRRLGDDDDYGGELVELRGGTWRPL